MKVGIRDEDVKAPVPPESFPGEGRTACITSDRKFRFETFPP